jgi:CBS domain-containing membrane protein
MNLRVTLANLLFASAPVSRAEKIISAIGAFFGIFLSAILSSSLGHSATPLLIASMGASAILLYAAPHAPMAQPWSFVGGHLVSALIGVTCAMFVPNLYLAAALAVSFAIFAMHSLRCLHPPGGATALVAVIGGTQVHALGYGFVLMPVGLNVMAMVALALVLNNLFPGRRYPAATPTLPKETPEPAPALSFGRVILSHEDLKSALKEMNAFIDVTEDDLADIYTKASMHSMRRRMGEIYCRDIMVRDVVTAEYGDELEVVWEKMRARKLKGVPVVDRVQRVIGIVTIVDFLKRTDTRAKSHLLDRFRVFIRRTPGETSVKPEVVGEIMSTAPITATENMHIVALLPIFSEHNIHHIPIVNEEKRLVGMVTQTDLTVALYRHWAAMP